MIIKLVAILPLILASQSAQPASARTIERQIGQEFCQISSLEKADSYIGQLADRALQEYEEEFQRGGTDVEYFYEVAYVGIKDYCQKNKPFVSQLVAKYRAELKKVESQQGIPSEKEQLDYNKTFRKLFVLTLDDGHNHSKRNAVDTETIKELIIKSFFIGEDTTKI